MLEIPNCLLFVFLLLLQRLLTPCADITGIRLFLVLDTVTFPTYIDRFSLSYPRVTS